VVNIPKKNLFFVKWWYLKNTDHTVNEGGTHGISSSEHSFDTKKSPAQNPMSLYEAQNRVP